MTSPSKDLPAADLGTYALEDEQGPSNRLSKHHVQMPRVLDVGRDQVLERGVVFKECSDCGVVENLSCASSPNNQFVHGRIFVLLGNSSDLRAVIA